MLSLQCLIILTIIIEISDLLIVKNMICETILVDVQIDDHIN